MGFSRQEYWSGVPLPSPKEAWTSPAKHNTSTTVTASELHEEVELANQFSHSVRTNSLWPHGLQHARLPCPSPTPRACSNLCPSSQWCHPTISPSVIPFSSHPQSFPASGSFLMTALRFRWPKYWSFSFTIHSSNEYSGLIYFRIDCVDPLAVQGTLKSLLQHCSSKASILQCSAFFIGQLESPQIILRVIWKNNSSETSSPSVT